MDLLKTASLVILFSLASPQASDEEQLIFTQAGHDCELQCQGPEGGEVKLLMWTRADLGTKDYVFLYRNGRVLDDHHHPSFSNRVQLRDPELKTGNLSVVLKNVTTQDSGRYRCFARFETSGGREQILQYINLTVTERETKPHSGGGATASPGPETGSATAVIVIVTVVVSLLLLITGVSAGIFIHRRKQQTQNQNKNPTESAEKEEVLTGDMCKILIPPQTEE